MYASRKGYHSPDDPTYTRRNYRLKHCNLVAHNPIAITPPSYRVRVPSASYDTHGYIVDLNYRNFDIEKAPGNSTRHAPKPAD